MSKFLRILLRAMRAMAASFDEGDPVKIRQAMSDRLFRIFVDEMNRPPAGTPDMTCPHGVPYRYSPGLDEKTLRMLWDLGFGLTFPDRGPTQVPVGRPTGSVTSEPMDQADYASTIGRAVQEKIRLERERIDRERDAAIADAMGTPKGASVTCIGCGQVHVPLGAHFATAVPRDPRLAEMVEYTTADGKARYALVMHYDTNAYQAPEVRGPSTANLLVLHPLGKSEADGYRTEWIFQAERWETQLPCHPPCRAWTFPMMDAGAINADVWESPRMGGTYTVEGTAAQGTPRIKYTPPDPNAS